MKKAFLIIFIITVTSILSYSQNIGIILGGSNAKMYMANDSLDTSNFNDSINSKLSYRGGFSFEGVLIPKKFYLQFNLMAMGKGMLSPDGLEGTSIHYGQLELDLKYKFHFDADEVYYAYLSLGTYVAGAYSGSTWDENDTKDIEFGKEYPKYLYSPLDIGMNFGFGIGLGQFQIGYTYGLGLKNITNIKDDANNFSITNRVHSITLGFYFTTK